MTIPVSAGPFGAAANAAKRLPSRASRIRSSCETAAPEIRGIGGAESRSKHMAPTPSLLRQRRGEPLEIPVAGPPADRDADEPTPRDLAHDDACRTKALDQCLGLLFLGPEGDECRVTRLE